MTIDGMHDSCVREGHPLTGLLIGKRPSTSKILAYGGGSAYLHLFVSDVLRDRGKTTAYRWWQAISLVDTGYSVGKNWSIGIRLGAPNKTGCTQ